MQASVSNLVSVHQATALAPDEDNLASLALGSGSGSVLGSGYVAGGGLNFSADDALLLAQLRAGVVWKTESNREGALGGGAGEEVRVAGSLEGGGRWCHGQASREGKGEGEDGPGVFLLLARGRWPV